MIRVFLRHKELRHIYAFERQELHLLVDAVGVARETAARADDAVTGDYDGDEVVHDSVGTFSCRYGERFRRR